jgi:hypothetical protein
MTGDREPIQDADIEKSINEGLMSTINLALALVQDTSNMLIFTEFIEYIEEYINRINSEWKETPLLQKVKEMLGAFKILIHGTNSQKLRIDYFNWFLKALKDDNLISRESPWLSWRVQAIVLSLFESESPTSK